MSTRAKDIMTESITVARAEMSVEEAVKLLVSHRITGMPVVDKEGKMIGIVSEHDILKVASKKKTENPGDLQQLIRYTKKVEFVHVDTPLAEIINQLVKKQIRRLPVVDADGKLVGIISQRDVMRLLYYRSRIQ